MEKFSVWFPRNFKGKGRKTYCVWFPRNEKRKQKSNKLTRPNYMCPLKEKMEKEKERQYKSNGLVIELGSVGQCNGKLDSLCVILVSQRKRKKKNSK